MEQKIKQENAFLTGLKSIFVKDIKYKVFSIVLGFLFWLFMSISI
ncbi:MAG TPA: hypothetical protein VIL26_04560 [Clostridia bacterium]